MKINVLFIGFWLCCLTLSAQMDQATLNIEKTSQVQSTLENNKALIKQWVEARNTNDLEAALSLWTDEWQARITKGFNGTTISFPDVKVIANNMVAEADKVALHWTLKGTHKGNYRDIPATGKKITWTGIDIYTIKDGKIIGIVRATDPKSITRQLKDE